MTNRSRATAAAGFQYAPVGLTVTEYVVGLSAFWLTWVASPAARIRLIELTISETTNLKIADGLPPKNRIEIDATRFELILADGLSR